VVGKMATHAAVIAAIGESMERAARNVARIIAV
jgi:ribosomal protein S12 methylthiotransferase accessory factor YcaO